MIDGHMLRASGTKGHGVFGITGRRVMWLGEGSLERERKRGPERVSGAS